MVSVIRVARTVCCKVSAYETSSTPPSTLLNFMTHFGAESLDEHCTVRMDDLWRVHVMCVTETEHSQ
jgi:hypothetical protein